MALQALSRLALRAIVRLFPDLSRRPGLWPGRLLLARPGLRPRLLFLAWPGLWLWPGLLLSRLCLWPIRLLLLLSRLLPLPRVAHGSWRIIVVALLARFAARTAVLGMAYDRSDQAGRKEDRSHKVEWTQAHGSLAQGRYLRTSTDTGLTGSENSEGADAAFSRRLPLVPAADVRTIAALGLPRLRNGNMRAGG